MIWNIICDLKSQTTLSKDIIWHIQFFQCSIKLHFRMESFSLSLLLPCLFCWGLFNWHYIYANNCNTVLFSLCPIQINSFLFPCCFLAVAFFTIFLAWPNQNSYLFLWICVHMHNNGVSSSKFLSTYTINLCISWGINECPCTCAWPWCTSSYIILYWPVSPLKAVSKSA